MVISRLMGVYAIIPTALLLAVSFFVLFAIRKIEVYGLRVFGYIVAAILWIAALLVFSAGAYTVYTGRHAMPCPMMEMMQKKMYGPKMGGPMPEMMHERTPGPMMKR